MRVCGGALRARQERAGGTSPDPEAYRILCLGESTTAPAFDEARWDYSWPAQLSELLRRRYPGRRVQVINKGVPSTNSAAVVAALPGYLDKFHPDLVISMLGVNDPFWFGVVESARGGPIVSALRGIKVVKLARYLYYEGLGRAAPLTPAQAYRLWLSAVSQIQAGHTEEGEKILRGIMRGDPGWEPPYHQLVSLYMVQRDAGRAGFALQQALALDPDYHGSAVALGPAPPPHGGENPVTAANYRSLEALLRARGVPLIAMQYPGFGTGELRALLGESPDLAVVGNKEVFDARRRTTPYGALFVDRWETDWGHCTALGNRLIAENVLGAVVRQAGFRASGSAAQ